MDINANVSAAPYKMWQDLLAGDNLPRQIIAAVAVLITLVTITSWINCKRGPPMLGEGIPFVTNTLQYLMDNKKFMRKAT
jgi:hypothetical protein